MYRLAVSENAKSRDRAQHNCTRTYHPEFHAAASRSRTYRGPRASYSTYPRVIERTRTATASPTNDYSAAPAIATHPNAR
jgi:hypothetical protein